ncbi:hypothetical protein K435DRAFT_114417 [Dendrothele bispora CBS 962.96]|uniref:Uncharacterized protein n=1 Tax=Dendrothele bispora (strain CBS 962.96) TaxID=1314807 RepID=A0A4S8M273_DENBC|nr:hypothetical protein K435DRAFT_114417 [Dendrothele bispora CBS 962.96]
MGQHLTVFVLRRLSSWLHESWTLGITLTTRSMRNTPLILTDDGLMQTTRFYRLVLKSSHDGLDGILEAALAWRGRVVSEERWGTGYL